MCDDDAQQTLRLLVLQNFEKARKSEAFQNFGSARASKYRVLNTVFVHVEHST
jgi:hypothetical protein